MFRKTVFKIALPVTLQSLLQSSFSVVDQVMIGQLGSQSIAGIGLGGKFVSLYSIVLASVASAAGIMISQYMGKKDDAQVSRCFYVSLILSAAVAAVFLVTCTVFPDAVMGIYTKDIGVRERAVKYLCILSVSFLPMAVNSVVTTMLRCMEKAMLPLYAGIFALFLNTGLNYLLIFGKWIFPEMGVQGAALASSASQLISCAVTIVFFRRCIGGQGRKAKVRCDIDRRQYLNILCPMLVCEFLWGMGENIYAAIYGNIGTEACAAMTMTIPMQTLVIGALSGLSQAAGILTGKSLGGGEYEKAYAESKQMMAYGLAGSVLLSAFLIVLSPLYVRFYNVGTELRELAKDLLVVYAVVAPVKVQNMILGGGIIRSGGKTKYIMWIDIAGTWLFGVPLGAFAAFILKLPVTYVYFMLSMEECVRLAASLVIFRKRVWMRSL